MRLTSKQESFAQCVAKGMTQSDAYRAAYSTKNMSDNSIHVNASKLMSNAKVSLRVAELRKQTELRQLWTREMSVRALIRAYKVAEGGDNANAMTGAVRELNNMHGFNEPTKLEHTGKDGGPVKVVAMTAEDIKRVMDKDDC